MFRVTLLVKFHLIRTVCAKVPGVILHYAQFMTCMIIQYKYPTQTFWLFHFSFLKFVYALVKLRSD